MESCERVVVYDYIVDVGYVQYKACVCVCVR